jgi:hypothetical protein
VTVNTNGEQWKLPRSLSGIFLDQGIRGLRALAEQCHQDSQVWFPKTANDVFYMAACMGGEAGETINEAKKVERGSFAPDEQREKILEEATDTLVYLLNIFGILQADPMYWYDKVREKNLARFEPAPIRVKDVPQA